jgi:hypothetical protein
MAQLVGRSGRSVGVPVGDLKDLYERDWPDRFPVEELNDTGRRGLGRTSGGAMSESTAAQLDGSTGQVQ